MVALVSGWALATLAHPAPSSLGVLDPRGMGKDWTNPSCRYPVVAQMAGVVLNVRVVVWWPGWSIGILRGERPGVHDGGAAGRRAPDRGVVQQVVAVNAVVTDHLMAEAFKVSCYLGTHVTAMPGDQNPHNP